MNEADLTAELFEVRRVGGALRADGAEFAASSLPEVLGRPSCGSCSSDRRSGLNALLLGAGWYLGDNWQQIAGIVGSASNVVLVLVAVALVSAAVWWWRRRVR